jgi:hypothetical protein
MFDYWFVIEKSNFKAGRGGSRRFGLLCLEPPHGRLDELLLHENLANFRRWAWTLVDVDCDCRTIKQLSTSNVPVADCRRPFFQDISHPQIQLQQLQESTFS